MKTDTRNGALSAGFGRKRRVRRDENEISARWLRGVFSDEDDRTPEPEELTGDPLYDAASFLCMRRKVDICTFERLRRACPKERDFRDIARLSGFPCREVKLPDNWPSAEIEPVLAFLTVPDAHGYKDRLPVVCWTGRFGKSYLYNPRLGTVRRMPHADLSSIEKTAWVLSRHFSSQSVDLQELLRLALSAL